MVSWVEYLAALLTDPRICPGVGNCISICGTVGHGVGMASKTGGGRGTNQHAVKGRSKAAAHPAPSTATNIKTAAAAASTPPATGPQVQFLDDLHGRIEERLARISEDIPDSHPGDVADLYADWHARGVAGSKKEASEAIDRLKQAESLLAGIEERNAETVAAKAAAEAEVKAQFPDAPPGWTNPYRMPMTCHCGEPEHTETGPGRFSACADGCCFQCSVCGAAC